MNKFLAILPAIFALALSAADAPATPAPTARPDDPAQGDALKNGAESLHYRQRIVTGKVTDMKDTDVTAEGKTENHLLAKVTTFTNRVVIVDLGARKALKNEIKTGDEIAAFGITGRLNELPLVVASKVATIMPIEGREEIFESIPVDNNPKTEGANSSERLSKEAIQKSNENSQSPAPPANPRKNEDR